MDKQKIMTTIGKCLSLAADPAATEAERDTANRKAEILMKKWGIERFEAKTESDVMNEDVNRSVDDMWHPGSFWELSLAGGISRAFGCECIKIGSFDGSATIEFFGLKDDLEMVEYFWGYLRRTVTLFVDDDKSYASSKKSIDSYAFGLTSKIVSRLDELYKNMYNSMTSDSKELIVVKDALVRKAFETAYPNCGTAKQPDYDVEAYMRGIRDADDIDLQSNRSQVDGDSKYHELVEIAARRNHAMSLLAGQLQDAHITIVSTSNADADGNVPAQIELSDGFVIVVLNDALYNIVEIRPNEDPIPHGAFQSSNTIIDFLRHS
jgi:hypothetical protein